MNRSTQSLEKDILTGRLDDILARIDAEYANYKQTPVFTCQEEELAYWSRLTPDENDETVPNPSTQQPNP